MAKVVALIPDLLFGSHVQSALAAAGHDVELVADRASVVQRLAGLGEREDGGADVIVVDLTDPDLDGPGLVGEAFSDKAPARARILGFYAHVDTAARDRAEQAGFDVVVPRSRMAREGAALVRGLAGS